VLERPRGKRPTGLTEAGAVVLRHADAMLARLQAVQADLAAVVDGCGGAAARRHLPGASGQILPSVLPRFVSEWPEIEVQLHESASDYELLDLVERGELDLTFCMLPLEEGPFEALELLADPTSSSCRPTRRWSAGGASRSAR
jgi:DNA-binding transcriptional LysR family regulator